MPTIHVTRMISAPLQHVWEYTRDFNGLPKWFPGVVDSHIEPGVAVNQPGCIRNFGLEGGPRIREKLLAISEQDHSWNYTMVESPLPITNYVATVRLSAGNGTATLAEITSQFDVPPAQEKEIVGLLTNIYNGAFELLRHHFETSH